MEIHQVIPSIVPGDAVSNECIELNAIFRSAGYKSNIYAENIHPGLRDIAEHYRNLKSKKNDLILYHYSIGSGVTSYINRIKGKKLLRYHNITPSYFLWGYNDSLAYLCKVGREELPGIAQHYVMSLADSEFNSQELQDMGFKNSHTVPIFTNFHKFDHTVVNKQIVGRLNNRTNILFVGKIAPHKAQADLVKTFYYYHKYINSESRLILVGSSEGFEKYHDELTELVSRLGLENEVILTGKVPLEDILAYYHIADVFVCASKHEGFCVPLVEAMHFRLPIIAYRSTAIPFTLGNSGVLMDQRDPVEMAEMINLVLTDNLLKNQIIRLQDDRLQDLSPENVKDLFLKAIEEA